MNNSNHTFYDSGNDGLEIQPIDYEVTNDKQTVEQYVTYLLNFDPESQKPTDQFERQLWKRQILHTIKVFTNTLLMHLDISEIRTIMQSDYHILKQIIAGLYSEAPDMEDTRVKQRHFFDYDTQRSTYPITQSGPPKYSVRNVMLETAILNVELFARISNYWGAFQHGSKSGSLLGVVKKGITPYDLLDNVTTGEIAGQAGIGFRSTR